METGEMEQTSEHVHKFVRREGDTGDDVTLYIKEGINSNKLEIPKEADSSTESL